ncbi:MAG: methyltransferase [Deltaproteobacteria bacterium]|nr:methyltransferase [Deltaproteobacteria bacterium]
MELTEDAICRGLLRLRQPRRGYRFNLDSVLLAAFGAAEARPGLLIDAGAGCGVVGLYLSAVLGRPALLVERQPVMAALAAQNAALNALKSVNVVRGDFRSIPVRDGSVGLLACNPPYLEPGSGRASPREQRLLSLHTVHGGIAEVVAEAGRVLAPGGVLACILPAAVASSLAVGALHLRRRMDLSPQPGGSVTRCLVLLAREPGPAVVEARAVHGAAARFAPWVEDILEGRARRLQ